jgi:hypothetical protein
MESRRRARDVCYYYMYHNVVCLPQLYELADVLPHSKTVLTGK